MIRIYTGLLDYLQDCPQLANSQFNFDFIGEQPTRYSITIPTNTPEIAKDALGDAKCVLNFYLTSVSMWGDDFLNNVKNLDLFQDVKKWFDAQNRERNFPDLGADKDVKGVYATSDGYIEATKDMIGRYQMSCKVEYRKINASMTHLPRFVREE